MVETFGFPVGVSTVFVVFSVILGPVDTCVVGFDFIFSVVSFVYFAFCVVVVPLLTGFVVVTDDDVVGGSAGH